MKRQDALITVALVLLAVFVTAFAMINYRNPVHVWPLTNAQPLTLVIGISFLLGAAVSGLFGSLMRARRLREPVSLTPEASRADRNRS